MHAITIASDSYQIVTIASDSYQIVAIASDSYQIVTIASDSYQIHAFTSNCPNERGGRGDHGKIAPVPPRHQEGHAKRPGQLSRRRRLRLAS